MTSEVI